QRGDVLKARFPHASGGRGKKRPVVVVQADVYNQRLRHAVVAQLTTNLDEKDDPACLFVEASTAEAKAAGLDRDCLRVCSLRGPRLSQPWHTQVVPVCHGCLSRGGPLPAPFWNRL